MPSPKTVYAFALTEALPYGSGAGSWIFHPLANSQIMKINSPKNVTKMNPRCAVG